VTPVSIERSAVTKDLHVPIAKVAERYVGPAETKRRNPDRESSSPKSSRYIVHSTARTAANDLDSEKKIDRIGDRLANIEAYLKRIPTGSSPAAQGYNSSLAQTPGNAFASPGAHSVSDSSVILADRAATTDATDATTNTHSVLASKVIEQAVGESPVMTQNPALATALNSLKDMLGKINETPHTTDLNTTLWNRPIDKAAPPSRSEIYEILRKSDSEYNPSAHRETTNNRSRQSVSHLLSRGYNNTSEAEV
jgi:hypothetical protein